MPLPAALAMVAGQALGQGMGMLQAKIQDKRQLDMNKKLLEQQNTAGKDMARWNKEMALQMWEATGYEGQRKQMEAAGINPGLMYGGAGSGGTTQGAAPTMASSSSAPAGGGELGMGMQAGMQMAMMQAQIEATKAQTENTKADTQVKLQEPGVMEAGRQQTIQTTLNQVTQGTLLELERDIKQISKYIQDNTASDIIQRTNYEMQQAEGKAKQDQIEGKLSEEGYNDALAQIKQTTIEQQFRILALKTGIKVDQAKIKGIAADITKTMADNQRAWEGMSYEDRKIRIQQAANDIARRHMEFTTGGAAQTKQWADIISQMMGMARTR